MRFKYLALLFLLAIPAAYSQAQVSIGVQIGPSYGIYNPPPVCAWGYYPDYPFDCAPYGYWGPEWFVDGVFIGAGPWYRFYYVHPRLWVGFRSGPGFVRFHDYDRGFRRFDSDRDFRRFDHDRFRGDRGFRSFEGERSFRGGDREFHEHSFRGGDREFRGGERSFRGGDREFHGGERNFHGGGHAFAANRGFHGDQGGRGEFHGGGGGRGGDRGSRGGASHGR
jgi:hypothetical protein